jgi:predicted nucleotide-binding protein
MGLFYGHLGRPKVLALYKDLERPSDIEGIRFVPFDDAGDWKKELKNELGAILSELGI